MIKRTVFCTVCRAQHTEDSEGAGFPNWGQLHGVALDGDANPHLCPACLDKTAQFLDEVKHGMD